MDVKGGGGPPWTFRKVWSCVFMYSIGHVQQHSTAPAMHPAVNEIRGSFDIALALSAPFCSLLGLLAVPLSERTSIFFCG
mmetsp:Transcript_28947/g.93321  ORF Transcript_28947/g.93321 Transcript_28947/m.93321 type:complete len:80 (-) Transcript_28947:29-268(-)